jgi:hypothetical protein
MAEVARPGMSQDEKDRIGQAEMTRRRIEAGEQVPDDQLDTLTKDELADQARLRGVEVKAGANQTAILHALRGSAAGPATKEA